MWVNLNTYLKMVVTDPIICYSLIIAFNILRHNSFESIPTLAEYIKVGPTCCTSPSVLRLSLVPLDFKRSPKYCIL